MNFYFSFFILYFLFLIFFLLFFSGQREDLILSFAPKMINNINEIMTASVRVSVLNNQYDQYLIKLKASPYERDAIIEIDYYNENQKNYYDSLTSVESNIRNENNNSNSNNINNKIKFDNNTQDEFTMSEINLAESPGNICSSTYTFLLKSRSLHTLKFDFSAGENNANANVLSFSPSGGHLGSQNVREIVVTFATKEAMSLKSTPITCTLRRIDYVSTPPVVALTTGRRADSKKDKEKEKDKDKDKDKESALKEMMENDFKKDEMLRIQKEELKIQKSLWGLWDNSMRSVRPATDADILLINTSQIAINNFEKLLFDNQADKMKIKKLKSGIVPQKCRYSLGEISDEGVQMLYETASEPFYELQSTTESQNLIVKVSCVADYLKFSCDENNENINFQPTFMLQSTVHTFKVTNESNISLPIKWHFDDVKKKQLTRQNTALQSRSVSRPSTTRKNSLLISNNVPCPFTIEPEEYSILPNSTKEFKLIFLPLDADEFIFLLRGETSPVVVGTNNNTIESLIQIPNVTIGNIRMILRGIAKRPLCHFEIIESPDYLTRRLSNIKNEFGIISPIESTDIRVIEIESIGLKTRNTFRFHVINTTNENYDFIWTNVGEYSSSWKCIQSSGILFAGKRIEMIFEYVPEDMEISESFYKFKLLNVNVEQLFLFAGKVREPKIFLSTSKIDFHSMVLGGEGNNEIFYIENNEYLPFQFSFDRTSLLQLEGVNGLIVDINPKSGTVLPNSKLPITLTFKPQEEVTYNFNILCDIKRKPNKLSINIKGEGYAVHATIQTNNGDNNDNLNIFKPSPFINYIDFGAVQIHDKVTKTISVINSGKYNFDYFWNLDNIGSMISLSNGKVAGTLQKNGQMEYQITFLPLKECSLESSAYITLTVAGKYVYNISPKGTGVGPALRFSFLSYDFGICFITSIGGTTVRTESKLKVTNNDLLANISIECIYVKTRALSVDCLPTMIPPGSVLEIPIYFAPREIVDYNFIIPFIINGSSKINVNVTGRGSNARIDFKNINQRKINFGIVNLGTENKKIIPLINKSKKPIIMQLIDEGTYGPGTLADRCIEIFPSNEITVQPRETLSVQLVFSPNKRIGTFCEDLMIRYAGQFCREHSFSISLLSNELCNY